MQFCLPKKKDYMIKHYTILHYNTMSCLHKTSVTQLCNCTSKEIRRSSKSYKSLWIDASRVCLTVMASAILLKSSTSLYTSAKTWLSTRVCMYLFKSAEFCRSSWTLDIISVVISQPLLVFKSSINFASIRQNFWSKSCLQCSARAAPNI